MKHLKAYVVTAMWQENLPLGRQRVGYRSRLIAAPDADEAVGRVMQELRDGEPRAIFSQPSWIPISPGKLASLGVDMTPFKEITP